MFDKIKALNTVKRDGSKLAYISPELQNDKDVVLAAVSRDGHNLEYASPELRNLRNGESIRDAINRLRAAENGLYEDDIGDDLEDDFGDDPGDIGD